MAAQDPRLIGAALIAVGFVALVVARSERPSGPVEGSNSEPVGRPLGGDMTTHGWVELREGPHGDWGAANNLVRVPGERPAPLSIVTMGPPQVGSGDIAPEALVELGRHKGWPRFCYERELQSRPGLQGRIVVEFVVTETGMVANVKVLEDTLNAPEVAECLTKAIRSWSVVGMGAPPVRVTYPFDFRPAA